MRCLYLPIFEAGTFHDAAITQKRGLHDALAEHGAVLEWDYLANERATMMDGMTIRIDTFHPTHVFTQFHAADVITPAQLRELRERYPEIVWINWSGDSWAWSLTADPILELAKAYDLWLVAAPDVLPVYAAEGIRAKFFQIAYEPPVSELPAMPIYDVVMLGNVISEPRRKLFEMLRTLDMSVGIYGDWEHADGHNTYHFAEGEALYRNATLAIADMAYPDQKNYISNRPFHILAAGGALLLHQHVERMDVLSGFVAGQHYVEWKDFDDLKARIAEWVQSGKTRQRGKIVKAGQRFVLEHHTWGHRVEQLVNQWLPELMGVRV